MKTLQIFCESTRTTQLSKAFAGKQNPSSRKPHRVIIKWFRPKLPLFDGVGWWPRGINDDDDPENAAGSLEHVQQHRPSPEDPTRSTSAPPTTTLLPGTFEMYIFIYGSQIIESGRSNIVYFPRNLLLFLLENHSAIHVMRSFYGKLNFYWWNNH